MSTSNPNAKPLLPKPLPMSVLFPNSAKNDALSNQVVGITCACCQSSIVRETAQDGTVSWKCSNASCPDTP